MPNQRTVVSLNGKWNLAFDPKNVGYETTCEEGTFKLDTLIPGNLNTGHEFKDGPRGKGVIGRFLRPQERWALIEFLKSL